MDDNGYYSTRFTTVLSKSQFIYLIEAMRTNGIIDHYFMKNCSDGDTANYYLWIKPYDSNGFKIIIKILDQLDAEYTVRVALYHYSPLICTQMIKYLIHVFYGT